MQLFPFKPAGQKHSPVTWSQWAEPHWHSSLHKGPKKPLEHTEIIKQENHVTFFHENRKSKWTFLDTSINQIWQLNEVFVLSVSSNEGITHCVGSCRLGNQVYIYTVHWLGYTLHHFYSYKSLDNINHESLPDNLKNEKKSSKSCTKRSKYSLGKHSNSIKYSIKNQFISFRNTEFLTYFGLLNSQLCP